LEDRTVPLCRERCYQKDRNKPLRSEWCYLEDRNVPLCRERYADTERRRR
jgi:lipoprotein NlpI